MHYIPNTDEDIAEMLEVIGVESEEELFSYIPYLLKKSLDLPASLSEVELLRHTMELSERNNNLQKVSSFIGGGSYHHFIPSVVSAVLSRSEFYTSYTPYQPEISQGTLQAIFEFQTYICMLTGMDVCNASMYDGASAAAEAVLMAFRHTGKSRIIASRAVHPHYRQVIETYVGGRGGSFVEIEFELSDGSTSIEALEEAIDDSTACVVIQSPNFFGIIEKIRDFAEVVHKYGALLIVVFTEALAYGLIRPPGEFGADIVGGEGQSLGIPPGFGGPNLGLLGCRLDYLRNLPGRLVGETTDVNGKRAYVLTLTAREQHIRRAKAASNICSNEGLCALAAAVYLSSLGKEGFFNISKINHLKSEYTKRMLLAIPGVRLKFGNSTFNEFVIEIEENPEKLLKQLAERGVIGGISLARYYSELSNSILITVTEMSTLEDIEKLVEGFRKLIQE
ncbi:aminomethyl-transferring glycine dehydrogenase subunit GcvPA [Candidatus Aerophobetes bacterium]|uniref:Probable glycine dehydrogenase (decarboxylating) subunit 1 n=1 Tax=Aerophobetes bacterium TaxID=2030807 RepID=A0A662D5S9_UNCAE|nr:MAG: aminomethyl-transferring glycine dehydrogenase subunit GcvPA [Candidatus Aerophobetes bacterium]